ATTGAEFRWRNGFFTRERLAVIGRTRKVHAPMVFAGLLSDSMPDGINVAALVGGNRNAAIASSRIVHHIALRLETGMLFVHSRKETRHRVLAGCVFFRRSEPDYLRNPIFADGHLRSANRADGNGTLRNGVHTNRLGESRTFCSSLHIFDVTASGVAN